MRTAGLIMLGMISFLTNYGQGADAFQLTRVIPGSYIDFSVDALKSLYLLDSDGQLKKLNASGDSMGLFNEVRRYGKVSSIDVTNPLKTVLFYRDFATVVVLDRFLARRNVLDLRKLGLYQITAVALAFDNGYWIYDELEGKVKHLGESGNMLDQFTDFRQLFDSMPSPARIVDQDQLLYLYDPGKGFFVFDHYGSIKRRMPFTGWLDFSIINSLIFGNDNKNIYRYDPSSLELRTIPNDQRFNGALKIRVTADSLYVLKSDRLEVYRYQRN